MKKYNKLVVSLVLGASVVATFGTAFALYKNVEGAKDYSIGIGSVQSHTDSSDLVTYKIGTLGAYSDDTLTKELTKDDKLSPDVNKVYLKVPLSFEYSENLTQASAQNSVVGRFSVTVNVEDSLAKAGAKVSANLKGYDYNPREKKSVTTYFTKNKMDDFFNTTYSETVTSVTKYIDTAIDASSIYCVVTLDFSSALTKENYLNYAEITKAFDVSLSWSAYNSSTISDFESDMKPNAYVIGDLTDWKDFEDYALVPNIWSSKTDYVEWQYEILKGFSLIKVHDLGTSETDKFISCRGTNSKTASQVDDGYGAYNAKLNKDNGYTIYYVRNASGGVENPKGFWVNATTDDDKAY